MASAGNQHCANCIGALSFPMLINTRQKDAGPILSVFFALIVHSELKSVHPGFPVAFIF